MTVWAYYRVSTDKQDYNSQKLGVLDYCDKNGLTIEKEVVDDGVSGCIKAKDRNLNKIIKNGNKGDWLIVSELSRLGRSTIDVLETCRIFGKKGINVYLVKQSIKLDESPMGKMILAILSAFAEMERAKRKNNGIHNGGKNKKKVINIETLEVYCSLTDLAQKLNISSTSVYNGILLGGKIKGGRYEYFDEWVLWENKEKEKHTIKNNIYFM